MFVYLLPLLALILHLCTVLFGSQLFFSAQVFYAIITYVHLLYHY